MTIQDLSAHFGPTALQICRTLHGSGFGAELVGGCVRDVLLAQGGADGAVRPNDVDITTSATPGQVRELFRRAGWRTYVQGSGERHGTIGVIGDDGEVYEVTTYRRDVATDGRHARVAFADTLEVDLERRDFTINAIACRPHPTEDSGAVVDPYGGLDDLRAGVLRAVGDADQRFAEDRLRPVRAIRFAARFGLRVEPETQAAIERSIPHTLERVSMERLRDELLKMATSCTVPGRFEAALVQMQRVGLLRLVLPELEACRGISQGEKYHAFDVFTHILKVADHAGFVSLRDASRLSATVLSARSEAEARQQALFRVAALLHDVGKPGTRTVEVEVAPDGSEAHTVTFHGHEALGAEMAEAVMERLKFSRADVLWVRELVQQHMRLQQINTGTGRKALRGLRADLQKIDARALLAFRVADKLGTGKRTSEVDPERMAEVLAMIEQEEREDNAVRVTDLALRGGDVKAALGIERGERMWEIGATLKVLLEAVIADPSMNREETLRRMLPAAHAEVLQSGARKERRRRA
jgi:putative nucleotidyltransferase with HDIG domain